MGGNESAEKKKNFLPESVNNKLDTVIAAKGRYM